MINRIVIYVAIKVEYSCNLVMALMAVMAHYQDEDGAAVQLWAIILKLPG